MQTRTGPGVPVEAPAPTLLSQPVDGGKSRIISPRPTSSAAQP
jgi:hypothetical protein